MLINVRYHITSKLFYLVYCGSEIKISLNSRTVSYILSILLINNANGISLIQYTGASIGKSERCLRGKADLRPPYCEAQHPRFTDVSPTFLFYLDS